MAVDTNTPVSYWEQLTLQRFFQWVKARNQFYEHQNKK
jgi:hypothetical protein